MEKTSSFKDDIVRSLARILDETQLTEIEYEVEGCRIRVARQTAIMHTMGMAATTSATPPPLPQTTSSADPQAISDNVDLKAPSGPGVIRSPMVGTAYMSASPGAAAFVSTGDKVLKGQTLMIIEAMKVMNQIKAHQDGVIKDILIKDADPVEYGQVLIVIS